jgi:uncharacterized protein YecE (DUF72 family)
MYQDFTPSIRVGCSGWQYTHWRGDFYPADLTPSRWLEYYAERFNAVEINNTFYRLPDAATFASWRRRAPRGFEYAVKASRFLTHMKKLKDPDAPLELFFSRAKRLRSAFGPVLYQLPPRWRVNVERFETFLEALPKRRRHVVEFREPSWYSGEVLALLERHRVALCLHDMAGSPSGMRAIGPIVYTRFHGPQKYGGRYSDVALDRWAAWLAERVQAGSPIYAFFNNDVGGHAPRDAIRLRDAILARVGAGGAGRAGKAGWEAGRKTGRDGTLLSKR